MGQSSRIKPALYYVPSTCIRTTAIPNQQKCCIQLRKQSVFFSSTRVVSNFNSDAIVALISKQSPKNSELVSNASAAQPNPSDSTEMPYESMAIPRQDSNERSECEHSIKGIQIPANKLMNCILFIEVVRLSYNS